MVRTIDIKRWDNNKVIFSYACENNTIGKTIEKAVKRGVSLAYANLYQADLSNTNLFRTNLFCVNLDGANLSCVVLRQANLIGANLIGADLSGADLSGADLVYSNLTNADLSGANLKGAELEYTNLTNVDLINAVGVNDQCPKEGSFIGWKKCLDDNKTPYIVKLEIPTDAKRSSATTNKCRCSKARVLEIQNLDGTIADIDEVYSYYDINFRYKIGEIVESDSFDNRYWKECSHGIHFFMNRIDAVNVI